LILVFGLVLVGFVMKPPTVRDIKDCFSGKFTREALSVALLVWSFFGLLMTAILFT
jgi:hypothetical protein